MTVIWVSVYTSRKIHVIFLSVDLENADPNGGMLSNLAYNN